MLTELQRIEKLKEKFLSNEEVEKLLQAASVSIRDSAILLVSYQHGLRVSEVGILQLEDFDVERKRIFVKRLKRGLGNWFLATDELVKATKKWLVLRGSTPGPLFPSRMTTLVHGGKGISRRQLDTLFKGYAKKAGLPSNHWNYHTLRHSCAVHMVDKDIPMKQIQDWLGHRSMQVTAIYANVSSAKREETAKNAWGAGKEKEIRGNGIKWGKDKKK